MSEIVDKIREDLDGAVNNAKSESELENFRVEFLGKKGKITSQLKSRKPSKKKK